MHLRKYAARYLQIKVLDMNQVVLFKVKISPSSFCCLLSVQQWANAGIYQATAEANCKSRTFS